MKLMRPPDSTTHKVRFVHAVVIHETGGPEVLRYEEVPDPEPGEGELLVRIEAAGVNHYDINLRAMTASDIPLILGSDGGGVRQDSGERVLVTRASGTYAELVAVTEDKLWSIPDSVSASSAAALGVPYTTAWWALVDLGELKEGDTLLVQAGSSGTGQASIDIGRAFGATVYATASESKLDRLRELGVEPLAYDDPKLSELGADVVFDPVGGEVFARSVEALGQGGRLLIPGAVDSPEVSLNLWSLVGKQARIIGLGNTPAPRETLDRIIEMTGNGELSPVIDRELPLEQAAEGHRAIEARETFGKVILKP
ncbi:MAG: zinc-binding dehydrogenase [Actinobacteria bacterium]|nr:MAG: zinc-binding dehydrogenase [Actinomycetota bacterium]